MRDPTRNSRQGSPTPQDPPHMPRWNHPSRGPNGNPPEALAPVAPGGGGGSGDGAAATFSPAKSPVTAP